MVDSRVDQMAVESAVRKAVLLVGVTASTLVVLSVELRVVMMVFGLVERWAASSADMRAVR